MLKKIEDIPKVPYGFRHNGKVYLCEPSHQEIQFAIDNGQLENRGYQTHEDDLMREWEEGLRFELEEESRSLQEFIDRRRIYHAKRIAHFVVHGWTDPIILEAKVKMVEVKMVDGSHRLKAAIYMGKEEVEVVILKPVTQ